MAGLAVSERSPFLTVSQARSREWDRCCILSVGSTGSGKGSNIVIFAWSDRSSFIDAFCDNWLLRRYSVQHCENVDVAELDYLHRDRAADSQVRQCEQRHHAVRPLLWPAGGRGGLAGHCRLGGQEERWRGVFQRYSQVRYRILWQTWILSETLSKRLIWF